MANVCYCDDELASSLRHRVSKYVMLKRLIYTIGQVKNSQNSMGNRVRVGLRYVLQKEPNLGIFSRGPHFFHMQYLLPLYQMWKQNFNMLPRSRNIPTSIITSAESIYAGLCYIKRSSRAIRDSQNTIILEYYKLGYITICGVAYVNICYSILKQPIQALVKITWPLQSTSWVTSFFFFSFFKLWLKKGLYSFIKVTKFREFYFFKSGSPAS